MPDSIRKEIAEFTRRLYERGLTTISGGNVSARADSGSIFITRSGPDKGNLDSSDICEISDSGESLSAELAPSMEAGMHLSIYRERADINAIIHAHPACASAFSATDLEIDAGLTGESYLLLGRIARVPSMMMGSSRLAEEAGKAARGSNLILIGNHGPVCLGTSLIEAYNRTEVLEQAARMTLITHLLGSSRRISADQMKKIDSLFGEGGGR